MANNYDIIIVGAGIVGLASALKILEDKIGLKLAILEKEDSICQHQSGNNSGVIHSGIYYKPGSFKAKNCIRGYELLLEFCKTHHVPFEITGKLIVATSEEEIPRLKAIHQRGNENGLQGIKVLNKAAFKAIEPHVNGLEALWVPQSGIVDYKAVCREYAKQIEKLGGEIHTGNKVKNIQFEDPVLVETDKSSFTGKLLINCAGLYTDKITAFSHADIDFKTLPFRGEYFELKKEKEYLVNNLVYPVPDPAFPFLGVHFTRMINGGIEAGPNAVLAFSREGYKATDFHLHEFLETVSYPGFIKLAAKFWKTGIGEYYRSFSKIAFTHALQKLIPEIQPNDLVSGGAGVRAQACVHSGSLIDDFYILEDAQSINVCNAPSPAATSSLAIGESIAARVIQKIDG